MAVLPAPTEILEMADGQVTELAIESYEVGEAVIQPSYRSSPKTVVDVRIHVHPDNKTAFPYYWDLLAGTLTAQLVPMLESEPRFPVTYQLQAYGVAPRRRYGVRRLANA